MTSHADELADLAAAALGGHPRAVRTFLSVLAPHLLRVVRRVLGAAHPDVDDVTQESLFQVVASLGRYRGESSVLRFCCRVAVLTAMNTKRREAASKRPTQREHVNELDDVAADVSDVDELVEARRAMQAVRILMVSLPQPQAEALTLHCVLGLNVAEISECTGAPVETVRTRLKLARRALRARLLGDGGLRGVGEVAG